MKIETIIREGWQSYRHKVSAGLLSPENEKMMQLQLAQIYQSLAPVYEYEQRESIKVLLEVPALIRGTVVRYIDLVISHTSGSNVQKHAIELKCFRLMTRDGKGKRGAQNLGMYDYWEDIENIEGYVGCAGYTSASQFTLTDDRYYPDTMHRGQQVSVYSTNREREGITGTLATDIKNRLGHISLSGTYEMAGWEKMGDFYFISQCAS